MPTAIPPPHMESIKKHSTVNHDAETELVCSIDAGTTSVRFIVFNQFAQIQASKGKEFTQYFDNPGWQDQDPHEIMDCIYECIDKAIEELEAKGKYTRKDIKVMGITNQRETTVVWDKATGKALTRAIAWPDARTTGVVKDLANKSSRGLDAVKKYTGLPLSTYFAAVKLRWMLENLEHVRKAHDEKTMHFGTMDSWILYNLTGGKVHYTDASNASRTMFMDLHQQAWCPKLCEFFGVDIDCLPEIRSSCEVYGKVAQGTLQGMEIAGMVGDQMSALVGQKALRPGQAKSTYGTGAFVLYNTGSKVVDSKKGLLSTIAYQPGPGLPPVYALEGSVGVAGSAIKWLRDNMRLISENEEVGREAAKVKETGGVYFVTAFSGLLTPYWDSSARGTIIGITGYTNKSHLCRATLEAVSFQTEDVLQVMAEESGSVIEDLRVDGGMVSSDIAMQIQSDILGIPVSRPEMRETTALGSALLAGACKGLFGWKLSDPSTFRHVNEANSDQFHPQIDDFTRKKYIHGWKRAVERARGWELAEVEEENKTLEDKEVS